MITTGTHIYFYDGVFSNWHATPFEGNLTRYGDSAQFNCREQYMMSAKAELFADIDSWQAIMRATDPSTQKMLGRNVAGFDRRRWNRIARDVVFRACWYSVVFNPGYRAALAASGDRIIVEASPTDRVWGIGLGIDDPAIHDPTRWRGKNWLGECHMAVRPHAAKFSQMLTEGVRRPDIYFNEFTKRWK